MTDRASIDRTRCVICDGVAHVPKTAAIAGARYSFCHWCAQFLGALDDPAKAWARRCLVGAALEVQRLAGTCLEEWRTQCVPFGWSRGAASAVVRAVYAGLGAERYWTACGCKMHASARSEGVRDVSGHAPDGTFTPSWGDWVPEREKAEPYARERAVDAMRLRTDSGPYALPPASGSLRDRARAVRARADDEWALPEDHRFRNHYPVGERGRDDF